MLTCAYVRSGTCSNSGSSRSARCCRPPRPPTTRPRPGHRGCASCTDTATIEKIRTVHADNYGVYEARKVHAKLNRQGHRVARCTVHRLMKRAGLCGITRAKGPRTTVPGPAPETRPDLVERSFTAQAPNRLRVADITCIRTFNGWVYAAFVIDVLSRRVVDRQVSRSLRTDLALDALEMAVSSRGHAGRRIDGLAHHSDRGVRYLAVHYAQRLSEAGAIASVGTTGDSYDNAPAEAFHSLFKAELIRNRGPWKNLDEVETAVAEYVDWFSHRRLRGEIGLIPPADSKTTSIGVGVVSMGVFLVAGGCTRRT
ncbi:IS3 family transposase [Nocardiopsis quinghaiensis]|uniref:IS3 family transposase n=1 Tax=Nocardiopsis quinghaiensis TaxID=464995 RepID=UPI001CC2400C|nr:IS3 family transposase [Nocardiopsis quinghaiensis]